MGPQRRWRLGTRVGLGLALLVLAGCRCGEASVGLNARARPGDGKVQVEWEALRGAAGYEVRWREGRGVRVESDRFARAASSPLLFEELENGTLYCFRVLPGRRGEPPSPELCTTPDATLRPALERVLPERLPSGSTPTLRVEGERFLPEAVVLVDGVPMPTRFLDSAHLEVQLTPLERGQRELRVAQSIERSESLEFEVLNRPPEILDARDLSVDEGSLLTATFGATDPEGDPVRLHATRLPQGARWDEASATLSFQPTFIQGGRSLPCTLVAVDALGGSAEANFEIRVADTLSPPRPRVVSSSSGSGYRILTLTQPTDVFLDSPGYAGREFEAKVSVPDPLGDSTPVRVQLHGLNGWPEASGSRDEIRIYPYDPMNSYWWGFSESLPGEEPREGAVPDYTARRVLGLLEWVLDEYPQADPDRVYLVGASMGGGGALAIGLRYARHFAFVEATSAQTVARLHRPSRVEQLTGLWGAPGLDLDTGEGQGVWSALDLARELAESPEAREQFVLVKHGKDDAAIHFGAAVSPSPITGRSFYGALQALRVGHLAIWDEASHDLPDPVLGHRWWNNGWKPIEDPDSALQRSRAFPAFSASSADRDPGDGGGNGNRPWSSDSGYAGSAGAAGDTGWSGEIAGALNRGLRWSAVEETTESLRMRLRVLDGSGGSPPRAGYPTTGERLDGSLPVEVDLTPRRLSSFGLRPGERVAWSFGALSGEVEADAEGVVTVPRLPLVSEWTELLLERR